MRIPQTIGGPALRAIEAAGITELRQVAKLSEKELLALHGVGPKAVRILREALASNDLGFKPEKAAAPARPAVPKKSAGPVGPDQVRRHIDGLDHPLKPVMHEIRKLILGADSGITEHIKWNSPSFCHGGDDRITFNIRPNRELLLVFHRGAKVKDRRGEGRLFDDKTGQLKWITDDRATVAIAGHDDLNSKKADLEKVVRQWIAAAES